MYAQHSTFGIIPARGGSKGLPGKNTRELCGKPLIAWTIEAALASQYLDEVMVSTDSAEIAEVAQRFGACVPFLRPAELATDTASSFDVVLHAIEFYAAQRRKFDYVALLQPTSPLRREGEIDAMIRRLVDAREHYDSIVCFGPVEHHPGNMKRFVNGSYEPLCPELAHGLRRQDYEMAYFPSGGGYVAKCSSLREEQTFYTRRSTYFEVDRAQMCDIDDIYDFVSAEAIMRLLQAQE